jgi:hypothetical protein
MMQSPSDSCRRQMFENSHKFMLACTPNPVNETDGRRFTVSLFPIGRTPVADVQIEDGIIKILSLEVQDPKSAAVLSQYPQVRWAELTRKAVKIGLGYLKGGEREP